MLDIHYFLQLYSFSLSFPNQYLFFTKKLWNKLWTRKHKDLINSME